MQNYAYIYSFVIFAGFCFLLQVYMVAFYNLFINFYLIFLSMNDVIILIK